MFSVLGGAAEGAYVLDLFAGTGSLGIEALSRGSVKAIFVEQSRAIHAVLLQNVEKAKFSDCVQLIKAPVNRALARLGKDGCCFDLILMDPPYSDGGVAETIQLIVAHGLLKPGGWLVVEAGARNETVQAGGYSLVSEKRAGDTKVFFFLNDK